jgi:DNA-binding transcriptional LysR family regulator
LDRLDCNRMFVAVAESGSFTAAAEKLGTSPGQASKLVSRLEADLDVRLLNRTTRAVSPTEAGVAYLERLRPLLEEFDNLDLAVRNISQAPRGQLRLSVPLTFGAMELSPALNDFARLYPRIALDVSFSDRLVNLVDEGFDMAVRVGRPASSSLIARKLCPVRIFPVAAPDYLAQHGVPGRPADLVRHECILDTNLQDPTRWPVPDGDKATVAVKGRLRFSNAEACLRAAEAGLGLAFVPSFVSGPAIAAKRVEPVLLAFEPEPLGVYVLYPHNRHLAAKVRALVDFLARRYRGKPSWEAGW